MTGIAEALERLSRSKFRSSFKLNKEDFEYIKKIGLDKISSHARDFIITRLAPKNPKSDGRQTPFKGHPVFKAQHATATCCRKCLERWHKVSARKALNPKEVEYAISLIMAWIEKGFLKK